MGLIFVHDPTAPARPRLEQQVRGLRDLQGMRIGVIDNRKPNFDRLASRLGQLLQQRYGVAEVVYTAKRAPTVPAPPELCDDLAAKVDAVITGSGD